MLGRVCTWNVYIHALVSVPVSVYVSVFVSVFVSVSVPVSESGVCLSLC